MNGQCLCGAVSVEATPAQDGLGACHCDMCRRWTSSMLISFPADPASLRVSGPVRSYTSSDWAERAFCETCGSPLWYRLTGEGTEDMHVYVSSGLFDETRDRDVTLEIYIDRKPAGYALAGNRKTMTEAEVLAAFAPKEDE